MAGDRDYHRHPRMVMRGPAHGARAGVAGRAAAAAQPQSGVGQMAGSTLTASVKGVQVRDIKIEISTSWATVDYCIFNYRFSFVDA